MVQSSPPDAVHIVLGIGLINSEKENVMWFCRLHPPDCFPLIIERINYNRVSLLGNETLPFKELLRSSS